MRDANASIRRCPARRVHDEISSVASHSRIGAKFARIAVISPSLVRLPAAIGDFPHLDRRVPQRKVTGRCSRSIRVANHRVVWPATELHRGNNWRVEEQVEQQKVEHQKGVVLHRSFVGFGRVPWGGVG